LVSASQDCTLRLWKLDPEPTQVRLLAKHEQPIVFLRTSERLRQAISVSRDGFVLAMSLRNGRYLRGFRLPLSDPSNMAVSEMGFVAVCFNGPDSHIVIVLDQNLRLVARSAFDGCVQCWNCLEYGGIDHLVIGLRGGGMKLVRLPLLGEVETGIEAPFTPTFIVCARGECFIASPEGAIWSFPIRAKLW
jgi:WD40 repeat protein